MELCSLHLLSSKNEETKAIKAKKFIKAKKQGQAEMALRALKPDLLNSTEDVELDSEIRLSYCSTGGYGCMFVCRTGRASQH